MNPRIFENFCHYDGTHSGVNDLDVVGVGGHREVGGNVTLFFLWSLCQKHVFDEGFDGVDVSVVFFGKFGKVFAERTSSPPDFLLK